MVRENGTPVNMERSGVSAGRNCTSAWMTPVASWQPTSPRGTNRIRLKVPDLLDQVDREIDRFVGDGIYDQEPVYEAVHQHSPGAAMIVPPRKDAVSSNDSTGVLPQRNRHIAAILSKGRPSWKRQVGYYSQSKVENVMYRYKKIIGGRLRAKNDEAQEREAAISCAILNRMREIGRPLSHAVR